MESLIIALSALTLIALIVTIFHRRKARTLQKAFTPEERVCKQILVVKQRLDSDSISRSLKHTLRHLKRLKTALVVYFFERYGVTIRGKNDAQVWQLLENSNPDERKHFQKFRRIFERLESLKNDKDSYDGLCRVCEDSGQLLQSTMRQHEFSAGPQQQP